MALPVDMRFTSRHEIRRLLRFGRRRRAPLGVVVVQPANREQGRVLLVTPKRVSKRSSERNRIKRYLDGCIQEHPGVARGVDTVVIIAPVFAHATRRSLRDAAAATFSTARRIGH